MQGCRELLCAATHDNLAWGCQKKKKKGEWRIFLGWGNAWVTREGEGNSGEGKGKGEDAF
jgi:hypothetical protein